MSKYRKKLEKLTDKDRHSFCGDFKYTGYKLDYISSFGNLIYKPTFMLKNVKVLNKETNDWEIVADHLWINYTKNFKYFFPIQEGDVVYFDGRIKEYSSKNGVNVKIERPTKVKVLRDSKELEKDEDNVLEDKAMVEIFDKENAEYYEARDTIQNALNIPHYHFASENYSNIESYLKVGEEEWLSQEDFKKKYVEREDVVELYRKIKPIEIKIEYLDLETNEKKKITKKKIKKAFNNAYPYYDDYEYY